MSTFYKITSSLYYDGGSSLELPNKEIITTLVEYNNNPLVYQDEKKGQKDPLNEEQGWYFFNSAAGEKINWYFINNYNTDFTFTEGDLMNGYALVKLVSDGPVFFSIYTVRQNDGQDAGSWYRSRHTYSTSNDFTGRAGETVLVYFGEEPNVFTTFDRIKVEKSIGSTVGPQQPEEVVLTGAFSTNSAAPIFSVQFIAKTLGFTVNREDIKSEHTLNINLIAD